MFTRDYFWQATCARARNAYLSICRAASACVTFTITPLSRRFSCLSSLRVDPMHNVSSGAYYTTYAWIARARIHRDRDTRAAVSMPRACLHSVTQRLGKRRGEAKSRFAFVWLIARAVGFLFYSLCDVSNIVVHLLSKNLSILRALLRNELTRTCSLSGVILADARGIFRM